MLHYIATCGIAGLAILVMGIFLTVAAVVMLCVVKQRKPFVVLAILCAVPLLFGLTGTMLGNQKVDAFVEADEHVNQAIIEYGRKGAQRSTNFGGGVTVILLGLCLMGAATRPERQSDS